MENSYWIILLLPISLCIGWLFSSNVPSQAKGFVIVTRVGFLGLSFSVPFLFYGPISDAVFVLSICYFAFSLVGLVGCLKQNTHPFFPSFPLYERSTPKKLPSSLKSQPPIPTSNKPLQAVYQSPSDCLAILEKHLPVLSHPSRIIKDIAFRYKGERTPLSYIIFTPSGAFALFPCNWSGPVTFSKFSSHKQVSTYDDTADVVPSLSQNMNLIQNIFRLIDCPIPLFPLIITTNPSIHSQLTDPDYTVIPPQKLSDFINAQPVVLSPTDMQDFFSAIGPYITKLTKR